MNVVQKQEGEYTKLHAQSNDRCVDQLVIRITRSWVHSNNDGTDTAGYQGRQRRHSTESVQTLDFNSGASFFVLHYTFIYNNSTNNICKNWCEGFWGFGVLGFWGL